MNQQFFVKYAPERTEADAVEFIYQKAKEANVKCKANDPAYVKDLACLTEMLHDFFEAKEMDYKAHL